MDNLDLKRFGVQELNTIEMSAMDGGGFVSSTIGAIRQFSLTEFSAVKQMYQEIADLIKIETEL